MAQGLSSIPEFNPQQPPPKKKIPVDKRDPRGPARAPDVPSTCTSGAPPPLTDISSDATSIRPLDFCLQPSHFPAAVPSAGVSLALPRAGHLPSGLHSQEAGLGAGAGSATSGFAREGTPGRAGHRLGGLWRFSGELSSDGSGCHLSREEGESVVRVAGSGFLGVVLRDALLTASRHGLCFLLC